MKSAWTDFRPGLSSCIVTACTCMLYRCRSNYITNWNYHRCTHYHCPATCNSDCHNSDSLLEVSVYIWWLNFTNNASLVKFCLNTNCKHFNYYIIFFSGTMTKMVDVLWQQFRMMMMTSGISSWLNLVGRFLWPYTSKHLGCRYQSPCIAPVKQAILCSLFCYCRCCPVPMMSQNSFLCFHPESKGHGYLAYVSFHSRHESLTLIVSLVL